eukprot:gene28543-35420_t
MVPESISNLVNISFIDLNHNSLTGTVPNSWNVLSKVYDVSFWVNVLSGPVPLFTGSADVIYYLDTSFNYFSSTLPSIMGSYTALSTVYFDSNLYSGTVPNLSGMTELKILSMFSNLFSGSLDHVFNATTLSNLRVIELTDNDLSGQLPTSLFSVPSLHAISLGRNCLHGSLPLSVCGLNQLTTLSLDGLMTASSCQERFFPRSFEIYTYRTKRQVSGGVPSCLLAMPNLFSLHMSANGIEGRIFQDANTILGANLVDLSLSFNSLTGDIPTAIQQREWKILDLSNNRISGTLSRFSAFSDANQKLSLQVNRISGVVPDNLMSAPNIQILEGNMFSCPFGNRELPLHDSYLHKYSCSSQSFNYATYLWRRDVVSSSVPQHQEQDKEKAVKEDDKETLVVQSDTFLQSAHTKVTLWLSVFTDKSKDFDMTSTVTIKPSVQSVSSKLRLESVSFWLVYCCLFFIVLFDMVVVLTVNIAYIYALTSQSREVIFVLQVSVALFKILWNSTVIPSLMRWLYVVLHAVLRDNKATRNDTKFVKRLTVELFLVLFNNLAATYIASALFNHNCFYGVFVPSHNQASLSCVDYAYQPVNGTASFECLVYEQSDKSFQNSNVFWLLKNIMPRLLRPTDDLLVSYAKTTIVSDAPLTARHALSLLFFSESEDKPQLRHLLEILAGDMGRLSTTITASEWV